MTTVLDFSRPHLIRNRTEYEAAVKEIDRLLDADPPKGSAEYETLEFLSVLVEHYEERHFPMGDDVSPQEAVGFMLEQRGMTRADLQELMGGRSRVSEFFAGKRELSKAQIAALRTLLGIPADLLLGGVERHVG